MFGRQLVAQLDFRSCRRGQIEAKSSTICMCRRIQKQRRHWREDGGDIPMTTGLEEYEKVITESCMHPAFQFDRMR